MAAFKKISPFKVLYPFLYPLRCQSSLCRVLGGNSSVFFNPKISNNRVVEYPKRYSWISNKYTYLKHKINIFGGREYKDRAGKIYEMTKNVDFDYFMKYFGMPNSFRSWFLINELHVWLLLGRLMLEGSAYADERYYLVESVWDDAKSKAHALVESHKEKDMPNFITLKEEFEGALLIYDEAIHSSDILLANALYIRFFRMQKLDPIQLEILISYVREQVKSLSEVSRAVLDKGFDVDDDDFDENEFRWSPLNDHIKLVKAL